MSPQLWTIAINLGAAWLAGCLIGYERSHDGRAAGFRTHALVCLASATVMLVALQPSFAPSLFPAGTLAFDPTRLAQGVVTGVGFLGAGVIFKEGVNVQGLTTAACIWATAAVGMLFGVGLMIPAVMVTVAIIITLTLLRLLEDRFPQPVHAIASFRFRADTAPSEPELCEMMDRREVSLFDVSYALLDGGATFEYRANLRTRSRSGLPSLAQRLKQTPGLTGFDIARVSR